LHTPWQRAIFGELYALWTLIQFSLKPADPATAEVAMKFQQTQIRRMPAKRRGLSLIEVIVVVTILGIIAAIVVPRVSVATDNAKQRVKEHHMSQMNSAMERYYVDNGSWPTVLADLVPNYLPDGVPTNPEGGSFSINGTTNRVEE
jgi:general secretion pathway protein G